MSKIKLILTLLAILPVLFSQAQDIHFSQFYNAPLNLNPALTGIFPGDQRISGNYRNQWFSVPVPYLTFSGAYDQKFYLRGLTSGFFGGGIVFNYDRAGDAKLSWSQLALNVSYTQQLGDEYFLGAGFAVLGGQRAFDPALLQFGDQHNGDTFDPTTPTAEVFPRTSVGYFDLSAGLNGYYQDEDSRTRIHLGVGFGHLNQPEVNFKEMNAVQLPFITKAYVLSQVQVADQVDVVVNLMTQFQGPYQEKIGGLAGRYHLNEKKGHELALQLGASYRFRDAVVAHFEIFYLNWHLGISYDINTSPFRTASQRNGGPELSFRYIITKVKPPDSFKACPIF